MDRILTISSTTYVICYPDISFRIPYLYRILYLYRTHIRYRYACDTSTICQLTYRMKWRILDSLIQSSICVETDRIRPSLYGHVPDTSVHRTAKLCTKSARSRKLKYFLSFFLFFFY